MKSLDYYSTKIKEGYMKFDIMLIVIIILSQLFVGLVYFMLGYTKGIDSALQNKHDIYTVSAKEKGDK